MTLPTWFQFLKSSEGWLKVEGCMLLAILNFGQVRLVQIGV
jgi:hypothetical protein